MIGRRSFSGRKRKKRVASIRTGLKALAAVKQAQQSKRVEDLLTIEKQRKANRSFLERSDTVCQHGARVALVDFRVQTELGLVRQGEKRHFEGDGADPRLPRKHGFIIEEAENMRPAFDRQYEGRESAIDDADPSQHLRPRFIRPSGDDAAPERVPLRGARCHILLRLDIGPLGVVAGVEGPTGPIHAGLGETRLFMEVAEELGAAFDESDTLFEALHQPIAKDLSPVLPQTPGGIGLAMLVQRTGEEKRSILNGETWATRRFDGASACLCSVAQSARVLQGELKGEHV